MPPKNTFPIVSQSAREQCLALVGMVGMGKSYTARVMAEAVLDAGERICIIDPTGVWWGLRLRPDGKKRAYDVVVFGGEYADVQINDQSGKPIAELLAGTNLPSVIDLSEFTIAERTRFMTDFLDVLYRANKKRIPITLVVDEADMFAPQRMQPDQTKMFSRLEQIVRRGRVRGFRPWLITQRPAELNKSVLSQAQTLVALGVTGPHDLDALTYWMMGQGDKETAKRIRASLTELKRGQAWVWTPREKVLHQITVKLISTYDSMSTPRTGRQHPPPKSLSEIDLSAVQDSLRAVEAEAKANDPKELKAQVASLKREKAAINRANDLLNTRFQQAVKTSEPELKAIERAGRIEALKEVAMRLQDMARTILDDVFRKASPEKRVGKKLVAGLTLHRVRVSPDVVEYTKHDANVKLDKPGRLILSALAQHPEGLTRAATALIAGYAARGGAFNNALGRLRSAGWAQGGRDSITITGPGYAALGSYEKLPTGDALLQHWINKLGKPDHVILAALAEYSAPQPKHVVAEKSGYADRGGSFNNALGRLRTLELITGYGTGKDAGIELSETLRD